VVPRPFVPKSDSDAVQKLRLALGAEKPAVKVRVSGDPEALKQDCYVNVRHRVEREGGRMQLGWAVWQHSHLYIEAEPHAVFDPGKGGPWIDCTPHELGDGSRCYEILFIPNDNASYDFDTTDVPDNIRVPLVDDPSVAEALRLFSERTALMNSVPGIDVPLPLDVKVKMETLKVRASMLLAGVMQPSTPLRSKQKVGRNDPCPCGSGKKYKKCHGA